MKARIEDGVVRSPYPRVEVPLCSFYDLAKEKLLTNPDKIALVDDVVRLTRAEVLTHMQRYAVGFRQHGLLPGDRVYVHLKNNVENLIAIFGCVLSGAVIILAKTSLTEGELRYQVKDSDSTHILTDEEYTEKVRKVISNLDIKGLFCMGRADGFVSASRFSALDECDFEKTPVTDPRNTVLALCYTSGTTGLPKGAEITHYNYVCSFYTTRLHAPWGETDVFLGHNPITHVSGLLFIPLALLDGATCAVVPANLSPLEIMDAVDKYKATTALFYPAQLQALVREMERMSRRLPSMRCIGVGGSVLQTSLAEAARKAFAGIDDLLNVFGMNEACGLPICQPKTGKPLAGMDVGVPTSMVEIKVLDMETGRILGPHQIGELCFRAESMVRGYYKRPKENADIIDKEGWWKTGDCGYYDEDGRFYILDRVKQMIKCMDNQVVPAELEELLLREHGAQIAEVCVVGLPHSEFGEVPAAAVVLAEEASSCDREKLSEDIKETVKRNLAVQKHLYGGVFFVGSLPKTETSKVNRPAVARALLRSEETVRH